MSDVNNKFYESAILAFTINIIIIVISLPLQQGNRIFYVAKSTSTEASKNLPPELVACNLISLSSISSSSFRCSLLRSFPFTFSAAVSIHVMKMWILALLFSALCVFSALKYYEMRISPPLLSLLKRSMRWDRTAVMNFLTGREKKSSMFTLSPPSLNLPSSSSSVCMYIMWVTAAAYLH